MRWPFGDKGRLYRVPVTWLVRIGYKKVARLGIVGWALLACGGAPAGERSATPAQLRELIANDARIAQIAYRLKAVSSDLCRTRGYDLGLVIHAIDQYAPSLRPIAAATFDLQHEPVLASVVAGGPAAAAGMQAGDAILIIDDRSAPVAMPGDRISYRTVQNTLDMLDKAAAYGAVVHLTVRRGERRLQIALMPAQSCAVRTQLAPSAELNSWADDRYVTVTTAMARFVANDDELALVIGHELAHAYLQHERRLNHNGLARHALGNLLTLPGTVLRTEREADYLGLYIDARAGYDLDRAAEFWRRFRGGGYAHPGNEERIAVTAATVAEIEAKRRSGQPLVPDAARLHLPPVPQVEPPHL